VNNILMITNADMSLQSGDVVLVNRRAESIYKQFTITTTCAVIGKNGNNVVKHDIEGIKYIVITDKKYLKDVILNLKPNKIIFYGVTTYRFINYVKKILKVVSIDAELLIDVQGAIEETIEYSNKFQLVRYYPKYKLKKILLARAVNSVNGAFVVSDELGKYTIALLNEGKRDSFKIYKFRCGLTSIISAEQKLKWRNEVREKWGINNETTVMVFSGYRMAWQNIDIIIKEFKEYDKKYKNMFFAFFCNIDDEFERKIKQSFPKGNYDLRFLSFSEYFNYMCACDVGFLVRDYNVTNRVAFPNKFSDYLNAGLMVALNKALPEPYELLEKYKIEFINIDDNNISYINKIQNRQQNLLDYYRQTEIICKEELLNSSQIIKLNYEIE
jgi:hypothetical protein